MREMFPILLPEGSLGVRTKFAVGLIAKRITEKSPELESKANQLAESVVTALGMKVDESKRSGEQEGAKSTGYLVFIAESEMDKLADVAISWGQPDAEKKTTAQQKKEACAAFRGTQAVDIALFGRMLADVPQLNTDASAQVAHAISVDRTAQEYDYFTAVDDCAADDNAGAGMIGTVDFNSSTLYRYATVNLDSLRAQLGDAEAAARGTMAFIEAFVRSMPTGKQNTFANRTLPNAVLVSFRGTQPINAVSAFEVPIKSTEKQSVSALAAAKLGETIESFEKAYGEPAKKAWNVTVGSAVAPFDAISERVTLDELLQGVHEEAIAYFSASEE
jgi:CRISPR system Cascade subunit CasC